MSEQEGNEELEYFTEKGDCTDEVKLLFDDGKVLYVSENLLSYASPVFKSMFRHDFKEKINREVNLTGKNYKDVLEFLLCLHPAVQRKITNGNVLDIVGLAEEYQVELLIAKCKRVLTRWLSSELSSLKKSEVTDETLRKHAAHCLIILHKALECRYEKLVDNAITIISKFGYGVFSGTLKTCNASYSYDFSSYRSRSGIDRSNYIHDDNQKEKSECWKLFSKLPDHIQFKLLVERLMNCDNNTLC